MKKLSLFFAFCILTVALINAQVPPQGFNYSGVARNSSGQPIASSPIGIQISLLKSSATGTVVYSENHVVNTDAFGLFNLVIGAGSVQSGAMSTIDWSVDNYYVKVGLDVTGGTNFLTIGTTQLLSVPYAMHAKTAESIVGSGSNSGKTHVELYGDITNAQADSIILADLGQNTRFAYIMNTTQLTSVDLSGLNYLIDLKIEDNSVLSSVNLSNLNRCINSFDVRNNPQLSVLTLNNVKNLGGFYLKDNGIQQINMPNLLFAKSFGVIDNQQLTSISVPLLNKVNGEMYINRNTNLTGVNFNSLTTAESVSISETALADISFPQLSTLESMSVEHNANLTSLQLNALNNATGIFVSNNPTLTSLQLIALTNITGVFVSSNPTLNNITWSSGINFWGNQGYFYNNNLPSSEVNEILSILVGLGTSGIAPGTCFNLQQNPTAPPTGQGVTDLNTLQNVWGICIATD